MFHKKLFLKILQYSQESNCVGISFLIKMQAFRTPALLKRNSKAGAFANIEKFLRTNILKNICERLLLRVSLELFPTWTNNIGSEEHVFSKNKTKQKPFEYSAIWEKLAFSWYSLSFRFFLFLYFTSDGIYPT